MFNWARTHFLPVRSREIEIEEENAWPEKDVFRCGSTSSKGVPLETGMLLESSSSSWKKQVSVLSRVTLPLLKELRECTDTGLEMALKDRKLWRGVPSVARYCWDISESKDTSFARHEAGKCHPWVRCTISFEGTMHAKTRSNGLSAAKTETPEQEQSLKKSLNGEHMLWKARAWSGSWAKSETDVVVFFRELAVLLERDGWWRRSCDGELVLNS